ncbi:hypothetical protein Ciccas_003591 [Cichlidogyrus casuarinus]|uniref:C2H2-type domain-containing protein n=1 Tax=Cichlidogyrus casuarinus TaxID=1844966 RepID=A0ABD2QDX5_9PLAT
MRIVNASTKSSASSIISNDLHLDEAPANIESLAFFCIICSVGFEDEKSLEKHVDLIHNDESECHDSCSFEQSESLGASEVLDNAHTSPESNHMECDDSIQLEDDDEIPVEQQAMKITEQIMASHASNRSYVCEYCECAFTHHLRLLHHVRDYHDG